MLNNQNERELCYAVRVTDITPIEGADKVELAHINGWHIMVKCVPIICEDFVLPTTCEMLLEYADDASEIDGGLREGLVFRSRDGKLSFKAVSNKFLEKYHG